MAGRDERGQATVEWVGLLLAVGLALAALAGGVRGVARGDARQADGGLGAAVAQRITCAARDLCAGVRTGSGGGRGPGGALGADAGPGADARPGGALRGPPRPPSARREAGAGQPSRRGGSEVLRGLARASEGAWLACLGYRSLEYDLEHPRTPRQMRPLDETLEIVNDCLNPWDFLFG